MPEDIQAQSDFCSMNEQIIRAAGFTIGKDAMILDYGCGSGRVTYDYLDSGYPNTFGYDVKNYLDLRQPEDIRHFRFDENQGPADSFPRMTRIPWPDETFDLVFATSVFEHVIDQETAYREVARVLKPGGLFLNNFPSKWRPIEPHIYVPFGGAIQTPGWYRLWATAGIRNEYQTGMSRDETARRNVDYARQGLKYPTGAEIDRMMRAAFSDYRYVEDAFIRHSPGRSRHLAPVIQIPGARQLFRFAHTRVILAWK